jgi:hypothetical protein
MYSTFVSSSLIANPDLVKNPKYWEDRGHLSLFVKLQKKQIGLNKIDEIFRRHQPLCLEISEWTAARESMKKISKDINLFVTIRPEVREILSKERRKLINEKINQLRALEKIKSNLLDKMKQLYGTASRRKLVHDKKKDIGQWPCFTYIMNDIYHRFKSYYDLEPRCQIPSQKNRHGKHSKELYKDIAILLEMYYPEYFKAFDWSNVKGRIKHPD